MTVRYLWCTSTYLNENNLNSLRVSCNMELMWSSSVFILGFYPQHLEKRQAKLTLVWILFTGLDTVY